MPVLIIGPEFRETQQKYASLFAPNGRYFGDVCYMPLNNATAVFFQEYANGRPVRTLVPGLCDDAGISPLERDVRGVRVEYPRISISPMTEDQQAQVVRILNQRNVVKPIKIGEMPEYAIL